MNCCRQFWHQEQHETILCEWNEISGSWRCRSDHNDDHRYNAPRLHPFLQQLKDEGFLELHPGKDS